MNTQTLPFLEKPGALGPTRKIEVSDLRIPNVSSPSINKTLPVLKERVTRQPFKLEGKSLRAQYGFTLQIGTVLTLLVLLVLFKLPIHFVSTFENELVQQEVVHLDEIIQTKQKFKAPPPPRPIVPIEVPNDEVLEDEEFELDVALDLDEELEDLAPPSLPDVAEEPEVDEAEVFIAVEEMPTIIGGHQKIYEFIEYPEIARQARLEGTVIVGIVITKEGIPQDFQVLKTVHPILDEVAQEAIAKVRFNPGKQRGKKVNVKMAIPIRFKLVQ